MSLWKIAWRSIEQRGLASVLTAFSMALGVALVVTVLVVYDVVDQSFRRNAQGYDLIVGAKGGRLELVLNTVYHLGRPVPTIPYRVYQDFVPGGRYAPSIETAIPLCVGDSYEGFPILATVPERFTKLEYLDGRPYRFAKGRNFNADSFYEAVVGARVADKTELKVGDKFRPVHAGVEQVEHGGEHQPFKVVGVLAPTGTPVDRGVFVNIEGFFHLEGHARASADAEDADHAAHKPGDKAKHSAHDEDRHLDPNQPVPDELKRLTAILVLSRPALVLTLARQINERPLAQAVLPAQVVAELFDGIVGNLQWLLLVLAVLVVIVAGIGILVSIYNSMNDRRREIAIMRALGARRWVVMAVILCESILLALGGGLLGLLLGHGLIGLLSPMIFQYTGVAVSPLEFRWVELVLVPGLIFLATAVGYLPAAVAYRTDVARALIEA